MTLKRAIEALPDDRETASAVRALLIFLQGHPSEPISPQRMSRATGIPVLTVEDVFRVLAEAFVINCGGEPDDSAYMFKPTTVLSLEIRRFLRAGSGSDAKLQRGAERFRSRYGNDR